MLWIDWHERFTWDQRLTFCVVDVPEDLEQLARQWEGQPKRYRKLSIYIARQTFSELEKRVFLLKIAFLFKIILPLNVGHGPPLFATSNIKLLRKEIGYNLKWMFFKSYLHWPDQQRIQLLFAIRNLLNTKFRLKFPYENSVTSKKYSFPLTTSVFIEKIQRKLVTTSGCSL